MKTTTSTGLLCLAQLLTLASALRFDIIDVQKRSSHKPWKIYTHSDEDLDNMVSDYVVEPHVPFNGIDMQLELPRDGRNYVDQPLEEVLYISRVNLNGKDLVVALDPTFSDFWVDGDIGQVQDLHIPVSLEDKKNPHYHVKGSVSVAPLTIGTYAVAAQSFVHASSVRMGDVAKMEINGILGLDLPLTSKSVVTEAVKANPAHGHTTHLGDTFLKNVLRMAGQDHQFYVISLADPADADIPAVLTIGEHPLEGMDSIIAHVHKSPLPLKTKWSAPAKALKIGDHELHYKHAHGRQEIVAWIDPATSNMRLPHYMVEELYKHVPGAVKLELEKAGVAHPNGDIWSIPCNTKTLFSLEVGGTHIPISPLQLSDLTTVTTENGESLASCISSIASIPADAPSNKEYDIVLGAGFFRNAYTVFGLPTHKHKEPYMQFRALHTATEAVAFVDKIRMKQAGDEGPELGSTDGDEEEDTKKHGKVDVYRKPAEEDDEWDGDEEEDEKKHGKLGATKKPAEEDDEWDGDEEEDEKKHGKLDATKKPASTDDEWDGDEAEDEKKHGKLDATKKPSAMDDATDQFDGDEEDDEKKHGKLDANKKPAASVDDADVDLDESTAANAGIEGVQSEIGNVETLKKLAIGGLALLALNALLALGAVVVGVLIYVKKGSSAKGSNRGTPHYIPVSLNKGEENQATMYHPGGAPGGAGYRDVETGYGNSGV